MKINYIQKVIKKSSLSLKHCKKLHCKINLFLTESAICCLRWENLRVQNSVSESSHWTKIFCFRQWYKCLQLATALIKSTETYVTGYNAQCWKKPKKHTDTHKKKCYPMWKDLNVMPQKTLFIHFHISP